VTDHKVHEAAILVPDRNAHRQSTLRVARSHLIFTRLMSARTAHLYEMAKMRKKRIAAEQGALPTARRDDRG
ncbi:MAG: hypothetical protein DI607_12270, partial [Sphingomonas hengshuiensis]